MSIQVKEVAFINFPITDVARARGFFEGVLGLKAGVQGEFSPGIWWIEYEIGTTALALTNVHPLSCVKGPSLALEVADLDAALATIRAANVAISWGPEDWPPCRAFGLKDPDGNEITLHQRKANA